ncbi:hypothetical protein [Actinospica robiniae]|uniref:hypothetical protein n=1 Tax=Actinospica robiniae TaxID=304901 RepID=UPI00054CF672|nr:hypothetical protein [Actinospica robiniae]
MALALADAVVLGAPDAPEAPAEAVLLGAGLPPQAAQASEAAKTVHSRILWRWKALDIVPPSKCAVSRPRDRRDTT